MFRRRRSKAPEIEHLDELRGLAGGGKPILIDFFQHGCAPCKVMDGIVNELADEFDGEAHIVKVNIGKVPDAAAAFKIQSTPTFVLLGKSQKKPSKKARQRAARSGTPAKGSTYSPRWRSSGLVKKDVLEQILVSNGARREAQ